MIEFRGEVLTVGQAKLRKHRITQFWHQRVQA